MNILSFIINSFLIATVFIHKSWAVAESVYDRTRFTQERAVYQQALKQLNSPEAYPASFYDYVNNQLSHYPLQPFWQAAYIKKNFSIQSASAIQTFLTTNSGDYIAYRLRREWLQYLAENQHWQLFNDFYTANNSKSLQCEKLQAELILGSKEDTAILKRTSRLWLSSGSLPNRCDNLFNIWKEAGYLTPELAWQRFELAYAANQISLAKYLLPMLEDEKKQRADKLIHASDFSQYWLQTLASMSPEKPLKSATIKRLLKKLASQDHQAVSQLIEQSRLAMTANDLLEIQKLCAWYYAKTDAALAQQWLSRVYKTASKKPLEHELRFTLQAKNWEKFITLYQRADATLRDKNEWLYWYAISLQKTSSLNKQQNISREILQKLSSRRSFYGLLAAEAIETSPAPLKQDFSSIKIESALQEKLQVALELFFIEDIKAANQTWYFLTKNFNANQWHQAAYMTQQVDWHERSIQAHAKAKLWDHTQARFPLAFADDFTEQSLVQGIQASWLFAMARQESAFSPLATSRAGAKGLLQLMPKTAQRVAQKLALDYSEDKLTEPSFNIALGAKYLKDMLERFDGNYILATAAYNAGPHRVNEWISLRPITQDWEHWVATIPYKETRHYVQNILAFSLIYQAQLEKNKPPSLQQFAPKKLVWNDAIKESGAVTL